MRAINVTASSWVTDS